MNKLFSLTLILSVLHTGFGSGLAWAENDLVGVRAAFRRGAYVQCVKRIEDLGEEWRGRSDARYWMGQCQSKLQNFAAAESALSGLKVNDPRSTYADGAYLRGQALFALGRYPEALRSFQESEKLEVLIPSSQYYQGVLLADLGKDLEAVQVLKRVADDGGELKQAALFQQGEIHFKLAKKESQEPAKRLRLLKRAGEFYEDALFLDQKDVLANQARGRLQEVKLLLGENVPRTVTGAARPVQPYMVRATLDVKYDSNIVNEPEQRPVKISNKSSYLTRFGGFSKYELLLFRRLAVTPELGLDYTWHARRAVPDVFANDNFNLAPALRLRFDHFMRSKPAAILLEYDFALQLRDYSAKHELEYYSRSHAFALGERVEWGEPGTTTVKGLIKLSENSNLRLNFFAPGGQVGHTIFLPKPFALNGTFTFEEQRAKDLFYDQRNYRLNLGYSMPALLWNIGADVSASANFADIPRQVESRGLEKNLTGTATLSRPFDRKGRLVVNVNYSFTKYISRDTTSYAYEKHVYGVGVAGTL